MPSPRSGQVPRHIIVADEDRGAVAHIIKTLRDDGHTVFHVYDVLSATELVGALKSCDLVLSNTQVAGMSGIELILQLRHLWPTLPIIYLAKSGRSTPELERRLPADVPLLREPFTAKQLWTTVNALLEDR